MKARILDLPVCKEGRKLFCLQVTVWRLAAVPGVADEISQVSMEGWENEQET